MITKSLFTSICLLLSLNVFSQTEEDFIRHTLQNYFNGTAYNHIEQIKAAFHPEAELYLENRDGELWKMTSTEYIALFEKNEPGSFGGRYSKILSIDIEGNLALAKAEILFPNRQRRYIDVFIMRKMAEGEWKIVSKAANSSAMSSE